MKPLRDFEEVVVTREQGGSSQPTLGLGSLYQALLLACSCLAPGRGGGGETLKYQ